jgi:hypothetical protein
VFILTVKFHSLRVDSKHAGRDAAQVVRDLRHEDTTRYFLANSHAGAPENTVSSVFEVCFYPHETAI